MTVDNDELKCTARRFARRAWKLRHTDRESTDWESGFNSGWKAAKKLQNVSNRKQLYEVMKLLYPNQEGKL